MTARATNQLLRGEEAEPFRDQIVILEELRALIPPLSAEELDQLEKNIIDYGCREALMLWETTADQIGEEGDQPRLVLIDGHNRHGICEKNNLPYNIYIQSFGSMQDVRDFMIDNQLGRRNLTPEQQKYLIGLKYKSLKQRKGTYERKAKPVEAEPEADESGFGIDSEATVEESLTETPSTGDGFTKSDSDDPFMQVGQTFADSDKQAPLYENPGASSDWLDARDEDDILVARFNREANSGRSGSGFGSSAKKGGGKLKYPESEESLAADENEKGRKKGKGKKNHDPEDNTTAEQLGREHKMSGKSVRKNEKFADGVERLDPEFKTSVLSGNKKGITEKLVTLGSLPDVPEKIRDENELDEVLSAHGINPTGHKAEAPMSAVVQELLKNLEAIVKKFRKSSPTLDTCEELSSAVDALHQQVFLEGGRASSPDEDSPDGLIENESDDNNDQEQEADTDPSTSDDEEDTL